MRIQEQNGEKIAGFRLPLFDSINNAEALIK
jgi:hypothetical protein